MQKKVWLLFILSLVFYGLIHLSGHLPGLLHGKFTLVDERPAAARLLDLVADLSISFLFSLSTYILFYYYYPGRRFVLLVAGLLVASALLFLLGFAWNRTMDEHPASISRYFRANALYNVLYVILGMVFYFVRYSRYRELQEKELQLQVRNAELSYLRSQINPHFLFNNLNNIYSLVYRGSDEALNAIAGLSDLLRYMLYNQTETVPLQKEIDCIEKYIKLQQLRYEVPTSLQVSYPQQPVQISIPPLLLIPFIENAFKHGAPSADEQWLSVTIAVDNHSLTFESVNKIGVGNKDQTGGIGIENVKKRLELLYPGRHTLQISNHEDLFTVKLQIHDA
jgi:two-component system LytT family sensor kinase